MNKILFILLLLFISGINLNAAEITFVNAMPIYLYGSVSSFATVYEFINAVVTDTSVQVIFALGITVQIFMMGLRARTGDVADIAKSVLAPITLYALFFVPTVNVHITDLRVDKGLINYSVPDGGYKKVDDVPYAIAFIPASSSLLVSLFVDLIDDNWNSVNLGNKFSTLGFQEMSRISEKALVISRLEDLNSSNGSVYNMNQYVRTCLVIEALKVPTNRQKLIHPSTTFPDMFDPANFDGNIGAVNVTINDANNTEVTGSCSSLYTTYVSGVATEIEDGMEALLSQNFPNVDPTSADFNEAWREHSGVEQAVVGTIRTAMATTAASRALERNLNTEGIGVNGVTMATEIGIETTIANLRTEGLAKFEWLSRMLPDALNIIMMIILGAFPLAVMVMSFYGKDAMGGMMNFFMGYVAMNFNLVSLALVSNIISYYTAQNAQQAIVSYAGMPFGLTQVSDFMFQQADMAGLAGLIGAVSVFAVTPLIFKGEAAGFAAAVGAVGSAFRGNVGASAKDALVEKNTQAALDAQVLEAKNERDAAAWLNQEGYRRPSNMSAVEAQNQLMKNLGGIGSANAASEIFHAGNAQNFIKGSEAQSSQSMNKTAGMGSNVDMASAGSVAFEDGEVMGSMINNTRTDRDQAGFNAEQVGVGQAHQQVAKDMGTQEIGKDSNALEKLTASARMSAQEQLSAGEAMLKEGFNGNGFGAVSNNANDHLKNVMAQSAEKFNSSAGRGSTVDYDKATDKAFEDGARDGSAVNKASDHMLSGDKDKNGNLLYDRDMAAEGQAVGEMAQHAKNMATAKAISEPKTGEQSGYADFINGNSAMARKSANDAIGVGEDWDKLSESQQISLMAKNKANNASGFRGSIEASNAEMMAHGGIEGAIKDMVTNGKLKGTGEVIDLAAKTDAGILDKNRNITDGGMSAMSIKAGEDANAMMGKVAIGENTQEIVDNVRSQAFKNAMQTHNNDAGKANAEADATVAPFLGQDGKALTGQDFWNKQAELKAGSFAGGNAMMFGDGKLFNGGLSSDGTVTGRLSSGLSGSHDETTNHSQGHNIKTNRYNPETVEGQNALEFMEHATNPVKAAQKLLANAGTGASNLNQMLKDNGYDTGMTNQEASDYGMAAANVAGVGLGALAVNQAPKVFGSKKSLREHVKSTTDKLRGITPEAGDNSDSNNNNKTINEPHDKSPNINSKDSITESGKTSKLSKPGTVSPAPNVVGEARPSLADPLTTPGTIKPSGTVLDNQSFFEKRFNAVGDAMKHTKGGFLKTAGLVASAAVLGQANETFANTMSAVDPMSYAMGSDLGGKNSMVQPLSKPMGSGFAAPSWTTGIAPQHANAFSQPSGSSTASAMRNAYNDNTSNVNSTPQEYQANTDSSMTRNLENINIGTEFNQEASEGVREAVEQLSDTIYKK